MAYGVNLWILLISLIQAEHVLCLWAQQARGQNINTHVGFSQKGSGFGGSDPQNQLRRASGSRGSAQSSSLNTDSDVSSGYSQRFPSGGYKQGVSQPARRGYASVRFMPSSSESKPNWPKIRLSQENVQKMPKSFGLSTNIASGSRISKYAQTLLRKRRTWPVQQGTPSTSNYQPSSSEALQSPLESYSFKPASHQLAAQKASRLTSTGAAEPHRVPARTKTSASAPARRVYTRRGSVASKPSYFSSLQNKITRNNPSQTEAGNQYPSKPVPVNAGNAQGSYKPASASHMTSSHLSYSQSLPVSNKPSAPAGFNQSSGKTLTSYNSTEPVPSSTSSLQTSWNSRNPAQAARNLPASGTWSKGTSGQRFAPNRIHNIPHRFGGHAIIRLAKPADQKEVSVGNPQQAYAAPQRPSAQKQAYAAPQRPSAQKQAYMAPQRPSAQKQAYAAPQRPSPQKQAYAAPQRPSAQKQAYAALQRPSPQKQAYAAPQRPSAQKQAYVALQRPSAQKQAYVAPQRPSPQKQAYAAPQRPSAQKQAYAAPQRPSAQKQAYVAPQRPSPQKQAYAAPQRPSPQKQAYAAPQRPSAQKQAYAAPQRPSAQKQAYAAPQRPSPQKQAYAAPQRPSAQKQAYAAPQRPTVSSKPRVQSVHPEAKWIRIPSYMGK